MPSEIEIRYYLRLNSAEGFVEGDECDTHLVGASKKLDGGIGDAFAYGIARYHLLNGGRRQLW